MNTTALNSIDESRTIIPRHQSQSVLEKRMERKLVRDVHLEDCLDQISQINSSFSALPKIINNRTSVDSQFLEKGMKYHSIRYVPDLKLRIQKYNN